MKSTEAQVASHASMYKNEHENLMLKRMRLRKSAHQHVTELVAMFAAVAATARQGVRNEAPATVYPRTRRFATRCNYGTNQWERALSDVVKQTSAGDVLPWQGGEGQGVVWG